MREMIEIIYTCGQCTAIEIKLKVPARTTEEVVHWVRNICGHAIGLDHSTRSPNCRATTMKDLKIPMTGADKIGGSPVN